MITFRELSNKFLAWCKSHQEPRTHEWYRNYIDMFNAFNDAGSTEADKLKPYQIQEWIDSHGNKWGSTYRGGAVVAIKRVYNWAEEQGYIENSPIKKMKKDQAQSRKIYMKPEDYEAILSHLKTDDPFRDLLVFVWTTGCRPQEVRHIEPSHVYIDKGFILFPKEESKGKRKARRILINAGATEIIKRNMGERKEGKVFLNTRGDEWTKFALCNRMHRLSKETGIHMFMYAARHGYATRKIKAKHGHLEIAATMGHTDGSMLAKVYSHIDEEVEHLMKVLDD